MYGGGGDEEGERKIGDPEESDPRKAKSLRKKIAGTANTRGKTKGSTKNVGRGKGRSNAAVRTSPKDSKGGAKGGRKWTWKAKIPQKK